MRKRLRLIGTFVLAAVAIGVVSFQVYGTDRSDLRRHSFAELEDLATIKVDQLTAWRDERVGDAAESVSWPDAGGAVGRWLANPTDAAARAAVLAWLETSRRVTPATDTHPNQYLDAFIAAPDGSLLLSSDPAAGALDPSDRQLVEDVRAAGAPGMGEADGGAAGNVHLAVAAPIRDSAGAVIAVLVLRTDPADSLFPIVAAWPHTSQSSEAILVRRDGDTVVYISPTRWADHPALTLRVPVTRVDVPAVMAVLGQTGDVEGPDYQGVPVLAVLRTVPGSSWFLVAKIDVAEALAIAGQRSLDTMALVLLAVLLAGTGIALALSRRQQGLLGRLVHAEREQATLATRYAKLVDQARDIFLLIDSAGRIQDANEAAVAAYGYRRRDLVGLTVRDLRDPTTVEALEGQWADAAVSGGTRFESLHRRKDGSSFPVEVSSATLEIDGHVYHQSFIRDISARRAHEARIAELTAAYATLAATNELIVRSVDEPSLFAGICRTAVETGGYLGAWVGVEEEVSGLVTPVAVAGTIDGYIRLLQICRDPADPRGRGPTAITLREGRPTFAGDAQAAFTTAPWHELADVYGVRAVVALPLRRGAEVVAVLTLYSSATHQFTDEARALLEEMAADISFALTSLEVQADRHRAEEALVQKEAVLTSQIDELRRWSDVTVGREDRILELKGEVNDLLVRNGAPLRYPDIERDRPGGADA